MQGGCLHFPERFLGSSNGQGSVGLHSPETMAMPNRSFCPPDAHSVPAKPSSPMPTLPRACCPSSTFQFRWHLRTKEQLLRDSFHTPVDARDWGASCGSPAPTALT